MIFKKGIIFPPEIVGFRVDLRSDNDIHFFIKVFLISSNPPLPVYEAGYRDNTARGGQGSIVVQLLHQMPVWRSE